MTQIKGSPCLFRRKRTFFFLSSLARAWRKSLNSVYVHGLSRTSWPEKFCTERTPNAVQWNHLKNRGKRSIQKFDQILPFFQCLYSLTQVWRRVTFFSSQTVVAHYNLFWVKWKVIIDLEQKHQHQLLRVCEDNSITSVGWHRGGSYQAWKSLKDLHPACATVTANHLWETSWSLDGCDPVTVGHWLCDHWTDSKINFHSVTGSFK